MSIYSITFAFLLIVNFHKPILLLDFNENDYSSIASEFSDSVP
jgi:hypothetical protein